MKLGPGVGHRSTLRAPITIDFGWIEPIQLHTRRSEHYIVGGEIPTRSISLETHSIKSVIPYRWATFRSCMNRIPCGTIYEYRYKTEMGEVDLT